MQSRVTNIPSGVEPIDAVLGGLQQGHIYLAHGDPSVTQLFGSFFLAEGLRRGEKVAMVINYSPEDVVARFARIHYDCLDDISNGRLIILECAQDIVKQIEALTELSPVLSELGWLMGETSPDRIVFDPIDKLLFTGPTDVTSRLGEFSGWARAQSSTYVVIPASDGDPNLVSQMLPLCAESFAFETESRGGQTNRYLRFEKAPNGMRMPIEMDSGKGIVRISGPATENRAADPRNDFGWRQQSQNGAVEDSQPFEVEPQRAQRFDLESEPEVVLSPTPKRPKISAAAARLAELLAAAGEPSAERTTTDRPQGALTQNAPRNAGAEPARTEKTNEWPMDLSDALADQLLDERWMPSKPESGPATNPKAGSNGTAVAHSHRASAAEALLQPPFSMGGGARSGFESLTDLQSDFHKSGGQSPFEHHRINARDYSVLVICGDASSGKKIVKALDEFSVEQVADGISGLARLISAKPDLVVLERELPIIDGFKVLSHVRASLTMPIIVFSTTRSRSTDRIQATDLGADYYLTAPFNSREVRQKARQLIARYRGIDEWLTVPAAAHSDQTGGHPATSDGLDIDSLFEDIEVSGERPPENSPAFTGGFPNQAQVENQSRATGPLDASRAISISGDQFIAYQKFVQNVEDRVSASMDSGSRFSIVGCRLTSVSQGDNAVRLFSIVSALIRGNDLMSLNESNDVVVLLTDADAGGARAFISRLYASVREGINEEPNIWMRSFPPADEVST